MSIDLYLSIASIILSCIAAFIAFKTLGVSCVDVDFQTYKYIYNEMEMIDANKLTGDERNINKLISSLEFISINICYGRGNKKVLIETYYDVFMTVHSSYRKYIFEEESETANYYLKKVLNYLLKTKTYCKFFRRVCLWFIKIYKPIKLSDCEENDQT